MTWLLLSWRFFVGAIPALVIAYFVHAWDVDRLEAKQTKALAEQIKFDIKKCEEDKAITTEVSHGYQDKISDLNDQLNAIKLRSPSRCIMPTAKPAPGRNAATTKSILAEGNGLSTDWLYGFAGKAEGYRLQLTSCQEFILKERK